MSGKAELTEEEKEIAQTLYCEVYCSLLGTGIVTNTIAKEKARKAVQDFIEDIELLNIKKQF